MKDTHQNKIIELYSTYNSSIKPLIAVIEARYESFPPQIFNELRAFTDHIAQCHLPNITEEKIEAELGKAKRHIKRIVFDCFKFLNVSYHDEIVKFEKQCANIDFTTIGDGTFFIEYRKKRSQAVEAVREAKVTESNDNYKAFELYEKSFHLYNELIALIDNNISDVHRAKAKYKKRFTLKVIAWFVTAILSGIISFIVANIF